MLNLDTRNYVSALSTQQGGRQADVMIIEGPSYMPVQCLGIYREKRFSPGIHAAGDAEILERTQAALQCAGCQTLLMAPEHLPTMTPSIPVVFSMCQSLEALAVLEAWEQQGVLVINRPAAVRACYRLALVAALSQTTLPFPRSLVLALDEALTSETLAQIKTTSPTGWWVKRGDVHAMQADDVSFVRNVADLPEQLARLRQRGVRHAVVQEHLSGRELKFYAVRGQGIVHAFAPHDPDAAVVDTSRLQPLAEQASAALGLEIYGGDCLLTADGAPVLIDINDWPSFRGCRAAAATHIAHYILTQAQQHGLL
jgi:glutathione synthase/RimK-type ligase-like ATP-grasp enzyme